jgi:cellulose synthase/poly-beta-1,6-N-acetylglucosamine synthase-like glycosyltransferase
LGPVSSFISQSLNLSGVQPLIEAGFFLSGGILIYAYLLYPLLLRVLPSMVKIDSDRSPTPSDWPTVSVIISAYNEAASIRARIRNFLEGRYPGWSEMIIVSDGSTDATIDEARKIPSERVHLLARPERHGKSAALEFAVAHSQGEIVVFSDATSIFHPDALTNLVRRFGDPEVGLVTGKVKAYDSETVGIYHRYERFLESGEAKKGVLATAHGCIYAMRRELWRRHDPALVDDFLAPILVSLSGKRAIAVPDAICVEEFPDQGQFHRQVRMVALAALTFYRLFPDLVRSRRYLNLLVLVSHKLLRWLTVPWLALCAGTSLWLTSCGVIYLIAIAAQTAFWLIVATGAFLSRKGVSSRLTLAYQFIAINVAALVGLWRFFVGRVPIVWDTNPGGSNQV